LVKIIKHVYKFEGLKNVIYKNLQTEFASYLWVGKCSSEIGASTNLCSASSKTEFPFRQVYITIVNPMMFMDPIFISNLHKQSRIEYSKLRSTTSL
jgi:hypothetical protein